MYCHQSKLRGLLALSTMNEHMGTFAFLKSSHHSYKEYYPHEEFQGISSNPLFCTPCLQSDQHFVALRVNPGDFILWQSRLTYSYFQTASNKFITNPECFAMPISFVKQTKHATWPRHHSYTQQIAYNLPMYGMYARAPLCSLSNRPILKSINFTSIGRDIYAAEINDDMIQHQLATHWPKSILGNCLLLVLFANFFWHLLF